MAEAEGEPMGTGFQAVDGDIADAVARDFFYMNGAGVVRGGVKGAVKVIHHQFKGIQPFLGGVDEEQALPMLAFFVFFPADAVVLRVGNGGGIRYIGVFVISEVRGKFAAKQAADDKVDDVDRCRPNEPPEYGGVEQLHIALAVGPSCITGKTGGDDGANHEKSEDARRVEQAKKDDGQLGSQAHLQYIEVQFTGILPGGGL